LIVVAVIGIVSAISIPAMLRARRSGNEAAAIGSVPAPNTADRTYAGAAGKGGFSPTLATLAAACPGSSVGFISPDLSTDPSTKSGYILTMAAASVSSPGPNDCNGVGTETAYYVTATPVSAGLSGQRGFASNAAGTIFFDAAG